MSYIHYNLFNIFFDFVPPKILIKDYLFIVVKFHEIVKSSWKMLQIRPHR